MRKEREAQNRDLTRTLLIVSLVFFVLNFPMRLLSTLWIFHVHVDLCVRFAAYMVGQLS